MNERMYMRLKSMNECVKSTREPSTYSIGWELWVLICGDCYGDVIAFVDNYRLVDNSL